MTYTNDTIADAIARGLAAADDPARPDDIAKSALMYARMSDDFRQGAWRHLRDDGDLPQASMGLPSQSFRDTIGRLPVALTSKR